jgi:hypothetical protein
VAGDPRPQRPFGGPPLGKQQIRQHIARPVGGNVRRRDRSAKIIFDGVIAIAGFNVGNDGTTKTHAASTNQLKCNPVSFKDWNRGPPAECSRCAVHVEIVRRTADVPMSKDYPVRSIRFT